MQLVCMVKHHCYQGEHYYQDRIGGWDGGGWGEWWQKLFKRSHLEIINKCLQEVYTHTNMQAIQLTRAVTVMGTLQLSTKYLMISAFPVLAA